MRAVAQIRQRIPYLCGDQTVGVELLEICDQLDDALAGTDASAPDDEAAEEKRKEEDLWQAMNDLRPD